MSSHNLLFTGFVWLVKDPKDILLFPSSILAIFFLLSIVSSTLIERFIDACRFASLAIDVIIFTLRGTDDDVDVVFGGLGIMNFSLLFVCVVICFTVLRLTVIVGIGDKVDVAVTV